MKYDGVILDFDGTLADTSEGVLASVEYALEGLNKDIPPRSVLRGFIGPSLYESFRGITGLSHDDAERAIVLYRENYLPRGVYMLKAYEGMAELLSELKARGVKLSVASSKPYPQLCIAIEAVGFTALFDKIVGPDPSVRSNEKSEYFKAARIAEKTVVVGDAIFDIEGAHKAGLPAIAATYGFGKREELLSAKPEYEAPSVAELKKILFEN